jgi:hypothetical protein
MAKGDDKTGRNLALVGGGAALLWLLLRGGSGFGLGDKGDGAGSDDKGTSTPKRPRAKVRVDADGLSVDGQRTDIPGAVALVDGREAELFATGAARAGTVWEVETALRAAGVHIWRVGAAHA